MIHQVNRVNHLSHRIIGPWIEGSSHPRSTTFSGDSYTGRVFRYCPEPSGTVGGGAAAKNALEKQRSREAAGKLIYSSGTYTMSFAHRNALLDNLQEVSEEVLQQVLKYGAQFAILGDGRQLKGSGLLQPVDPSCYSSDELLQMTEKLKVVSGPIYEAYQAQLYDAEIAIRLRLGDSFDDMEALWWEQEENGVIVPHDHPERDAYDAYADYRSDVDQIYANRIDELLALELRISRGMLTTSKAEELINADDLAVLCCVESPGQRRRFLADLTTLNGWRFGWAEPINQSGLELLVYPTSLLSR